MYSPSGTFLTIWQQLEQWDRSVFIKLNSDWTNALFDAVLPIMRNSVVWAPLYLFVLVFMATNFGRKGLWWSTCFILSVSLTDLTGMWVFKENIARERPCSDPQFANSVRLLLKQCSGSYSFVSNHAANHFALATFAVLTFRGLFRRWMYLAYIWAVLIAYAQVYVGVHYPLDVLGGAGLGTLVGWGMALFFDRKWGYFKPEL